MGTYKAAYSVTDSKGNVTNKVITVIVKKRETGSSDTNKSNLKSGTDNKKKPSKNSSSGFEFFDVPPSGEDVNGDVPASGEHVGNW